METYPFNAVRHVETIDGKRRLDHEIHFTSRRSAHFYQGSTRYDVAPQGPDSPTVVIIKETPVPGWNLPDFVENQPHENPDKT